MISRFVIATSLIFGFQLATADNSKIALKSGPDQVSLLELYSSEGCSSCPPADQWLAALRQDQMLWRRFIPLEFHVDYWNQLGWIDPFSRTTFTTRQREFAQRWPRPNVYTPAFILNGQEFRPSEFWKSHLSSKKVGDLEVNQTSGSHFQVRFRPLLESKMSYIIHAAVLGNGLTSKIPSGENAGKKLTHEFVVLNLKEAPLTTPESGKEHSAAGQIEVELPQFLNASSYSLVFWVSSLNSPLPIQAVGQEISLKQLKK